MNVKLVDLPREGLILYLQSLDHRHTVVVAKNNQSQTSLAREFPRIRILSRAAAFAPLSPPVVARTVVVEGASDLSDALRTFASLHIQIPTFAAVLAHLDARKTGNFQGQDMHEILAAHESEISDKFPTARLFFQLRGLGFGVMYEAATKSLAFSCFDPWPLLRIRLAETSEIILMNFGASETNSVPFPPSTKLSSRVFLTRTPPVRIVGGPFSSEFPIIAFSSYRETPQVPTNSPYVVLFGSPEIAAPEIARQPLNASVDLLERQFRIAREAQTATPGNFTRRFQLLCLLTQTAHTWVFTSDTRKFLELIPSNIRGRPRVRQAAPKPRLPLADGETSDPFLVMKKKQTQSTLHKWLVPGIGPALDNSNQPSGNETEIESPDVRRKCVSAASSALSLPRPLSKRRRLFSCCVCVCT